MLGYTGLRWGEATTLRVCDIDFDRRRIDVRRAFSDVGEPPGSAPARERITQLVRAAPCLEACILPRGSVDLDWCQLPLDQARVGYRSYSRRMILSEHYSNM